MTEPFTVRDLLTAAKRVWGGSHLIVGQCTDGLAEHWFLFEETGHPYRANRHLEVLCQGHSAAELMKSIESSCVGTEA